MVTEQDKLIGKHPPLAQGLLFQFNNIKKTIAGSASPAGARSHIFVRFVVQRYETGTSEREIKKNNEL